MKLTTYLKYKGVKLPQKSDHNFDVDDFSRGYNQSCTDHQELGVVIDREKLAIWFADNLWKFRFNESKGIDCNGLSKELISCSKDWMSVKVVKQ